MLAHSAVPEHLFHLKSIFVKLGVSERTSAGNVALRRGIVHIE
jgi:hypothetical protein